MREILQADLLEGEGHRVLVVVLSGLRYDALVTPGVAALREWREALAPDSFLCKLEAMVPTLSLPNWLAIMAGVPPEVHGLLGNRAPPEPAFSSLVSVMRELHYRYIAVASPLHCRYKTGTLPLRCCYVTGTLPLHYRYR